MKELKLHLRQIIQLEQDKISRQVVLIQSWYRGCITRKKLYKAGILHRKSKWDLTPWTLHLASIILIQATWRGFIVRKTFRDKIQIRILKATLNQSLHKISTLEHHVMELQEKAQQDHIEIAKLGKLLNETIAFIKTIQ